MRRLLLALAFAGPAFGQALGPFDYYEFKPGTLGGACKVSKCPGACYIEETGEFWTCPAATLVWTEAPVTTVGGSAGAAGEVQFSDGSVLDSDPTFKFQTATKELEVNRIELGTGADATQTLRESFFGDKARRIEDYDTASDQSAVYFGGQSGWTMEHQYWAGATATRCNALGLQAHAGTSIKLGDDSAGCEANVDFYTFFQALYGGTFAGIVNISGTIRESAITDDVFASTTHTQAAATQLTGMLSWVESVKSTDDAVKLPACTPGARHLTFNADMERAGTHTGANNAAVLTDSAISANARDFPSPDGITGRTITNVTDGSSCSITANTATTVTCTLAGGAENDWDFDDDYSIPVGAAMAVYPTSGEDLGEGADCSADCDIRVPVAFGMICRCLDDTQAFCEFINVADWD
jgi:hypothetical protein